jgi:hypothetical protein
LAIDTIDSTHYAVTTDDGQMTAAREAAVDVEGDSDLPRRAAHPFDR